MRTTPRRIRGFRFLTEKPVLVLLNVGEATSATRRRWSTGSHRPTSTSRRSSTRSRRKIEMELGELEPDEAAVFREELGITEPSLERVIALSYRLLGLIRSSPPAPTRCAPGRSTTARPRWTPPAPSTPTSPRASSAPRPCPTRTCSARVDGGGAQGRSTALRGQDVRGQGRRRAGDPLQPLTVLASAPRAARSHVRFATATHWLPSWRPRSAARPGLRRVDRAGDHPAIEAPERTSITDIAGRSVRAMDRPGVKSLDFRRSAGLLAGRMVQRADHGLEARAGERRAF